MKSKHSDKAFQRIQEFLSRESFSGFTAEDLFIKQFIPKGWGQDIAALSNMAEVLRNLHTTETHDHSSLKKLIERVVVYAQHPAVSPWRRYRLLQEKDPQAAGEYWRKNKAAIKACYHH